VFLPVFLRIRPWARRDGAPSARKGGAQNAGDLRKSVLLALAARGWTPPTFKDFFLFLESPWAVSRTGTVLSACGEKDKRDGNGGSFGARGCSTTTAGDRGDEIFGSVELDTRRTGEADYGGHSEREGGGSARRGRRRSQVLGCRGHAASRYWNDYGRKMRTQCSLRHHRLRLGFALRRQSPAEPASR